MAKKRLASASISTMTKKSKPNFVPEIVPTGSQQRGIKGRLTFEHCTS